MATTGKDVSLLWSGSAIDIDSVSFDPPSDDWKMDNWHDLHGVKSWSLSGSFKAIEPYKLLDGNLFQAYLKKGNKLYLRNALGTITASVNDSEIWKDVKTGYKNGDVLSVDYGWTTNDN